MSTYDLDERTAWYKREPVLIALLFFDLMLFITALVCNFIPKVARDSSIHEENGTFLLVFQICTTVAAFIYSVIMGFRWFVNIFTHKPPTVFKLIMDLIFCASSLALAVAFLIFGDSTLQKCAFWAGIDVFLNVNEFLLHLTHRSKVNH